MKLDNFLTLYTKINSKWIKDLNVRPEIKKSYKKTWAVTSLKSALSVIFLAMSPWTRATKAKICK